MNFDAVIGHQDIIRALDSALLSGKVGHAYLFAGPTGVGKKTLARAFVNRLFCQNGEAAPDCQCESCRRLREDVHPDLIKVIPDGNSIKIEQLREMQRQAYLGSILAGYKVFFFPEAEKLTDAAANSFLKILEEAPAGVVFLFTAVRADYILPTIRSRCQVYHLSPVPQELIAAALQARGFSTEEARRRAAMSGGLPEVACESTTDNPEPLVTQLTKILHEDLLSQLKFANDQEGKDRSQALLMLQTWQAQLREELLQIQKIGKTTDLSATRRMIKLIENLERVIMMVEQNTNLRLALEDFFLGAKVDGKEMV